MNTTTGLEKLLESLVNQSNGCGQGTERYILSGIIDYTKELIEQEKKEGKKYSGEDIGEMMKGAYMAGAPPHTKNNYAIELIEALAENLELQLSVRGCQTESAALKSDADSLGGLDLLSQARIFLMDALK